MKPTETVRRRFTAWLPMSAVVAAVLFASSASAIPVGVANLLSRKPAAAAKPAATRVGTKSCPSKQVRPNSAVKKTAADKSAGLTSFSRWFL